MNKKYMDFVPVNKSSSIASAGKSKVASSTSVRKSSVRRSIKPVRNTRQARTVYTELPSMDDGLLTRDVELETFSLDGGTEFGVVEELPSRFVNTEVEKRPLSRGGNMSRAMSSGAGVGVISSGSTVNAGDAGVKAQEVKAKKIGLRRSKKASKSVEKPVEKPKSSGRANSAYTVPKNPFINQSSVAKRPLSKNVYAKKIEPTKEVNKGPVAIISKPEKDSRAGLVVGIILTIILGAAAGTIAFLLLPK